jgi:hypothetical protein
VYQEDAGEREDVEGGETLIDSWENCYSQGWGKNLVPEAFSHPAKVSFSLAGRIYNHAIDMGWVKRGDLVLDPFAGIAGFGFHALCYGLNFVGVELEEKFVSLGQQNISLWLRQLRGWPNLGTARIVQGDSRKLKFYMAKMIGNPTLIVSSPPYSGSAEAIHAGIDWEKAGRRDRLKPSAKRHAVMGDMSTPLTYGRSQGQLGAMKEGNFQDVIKADLVVSSPPYAGQEQHGRPTKRDPEFFEGRTIGIHGCQDYGHTPGNLANMKEGDVDLVVSSPNFPTDQPCPSQTRAKKDYYAFTRGDGTKFDHQMRSKGNLATMKEGDISLVISSPPYADQPIQKNSGSIDRKKQYKTYRSQGGGASFEAFCKTQELHSGDYGQSPGQLGSLKEGSFDAVVSSPPYSDIRQDGGSHRDGYKGLTNYSGEPRNYWPTQRDQKNLGNVPPDTFWSASKEIVQGCYELLRPGGHAIWVTKSYCKAGRIVDFPDRWKKLCESVGFKTVCEHRAMLIKEYGTQIKMNGEDQTISVERKSFFRRLHESKRPDLKINWEMVTCMEKRG